jgi:hypothetical protein
MYVCVCVCVCVSVCVRLCGTPGATSTKLGTHMTICMYKNLVLYIYIYIYIYRTGCMCVCGYVCSGITLERLKDFQPKLVHI